MSAVETSGTFPSRTAPWASLVSAEEIEVYELYNLGFADSLSSLTKEVVVYGLYNLALLDLVVIVGVVPGNQGANAEGQSKFARSLVSTSRNVAGMHPVNWFSLRCNSSSLSSLPSSAGISPVNWFAGRLSVVRLVRLPSQAGIFPVSCFRRGPVLGGWSGCPVPPESPRSTRCPPSTVLGGW